MDAITSPPVQDTLPPPPPPSSVPVVFTGLRSDFRGLAMRGGALELLTVGFYRFWLTTNIRRHLWSHTEVDGDAPEYTGKAKELLIGFLFALAVLAPVYLGYFLLGLEAEQVQAFASIPLVVVFYLFGQFAIYRARRYRVTRTVWRGVRFGMGGSGLSFMWRAALWGTFTGVTLGLALPWKQAALERYKMRHTSYGDLEGRFEGTGGQLFRRGWPLWLMGVLLFAVIIAVAVAVAAAMEKSGAPQPLIAAIPGILMFIGMLAVPFIYGRYKAIEWNWWINGLRFGEVRFESTLPKSGLTGLYWKVIGWALLLGLFLALWIGAVFGATAAISGGFNGIGASPPWVAVALVVVGYFITAVGYGVVMRLYLTHDIWARVAASTTVHNTGAAQAEASHAAMAGAIGEGFADGLDVGGF